MSDRKLSEEETAALLAGLDESPDQAATGLSPDGEVKNFVFGRDDMNLMGDFTALRLLNERFSRAVRMVFLPMLRFQPRINTFPPEIKTLDEYIEGLDSFMSLNIAKIEELRGGQALFTFEPRFITLIVNRFYGGEGMSGPAEDSDDPRNEFTPTEERITRVLLEDMFKTLSSSWRELIDLTFNMQNSETNSQFLSFVEGADTVVVCNFVIQLPDTEPTQFDIVYPLQALKPLAPQLRSSIQADTGEPDASWQERLSQAVMDVTMPLTSRIAEPSISIEEMMLLKTGTILQITPIENVEVFVSDKKFFNARMGDVEGTSAIRLDSIMPH